MKGNLPITPSVLREIQAPLFDVFAKTSPDKADFFNALEREIGRRNHLQEVSLEETRQLKKMFAESFLRWMAIWLATALWGCTLTVFFNKAQLELFIKEIDFLATLTGTAIYAVLYKEPSKKLIADGAAQGIYFLYGLGCRVLYYGMIYLLSPMGGLGIILSNLLYYRLAWAMTVNSFGIIGLWTILLKDQRAFLEPIMRGVKGGFYCFKLLSSQIDRFINPILSCLIPAPWPCTVEGLIQSLYHFYQKFTLRDLLFNFIFVSPTIDNRDLKFLLGPYFKKGRKAGKLVHQIPLHQIFLEGKLILPLHDLPEGLTIAHHSDGEMQLFLTSDKGTILFFRTCQQSLLSKSALTTSPSTEKDYVWKALFSPKGRNTYHEIAVSGTCLEEMLRLPYSVAPADEEEVQESSILRGDVTDDRPIDPNISPKGRNPYLEIAVLGTCLDEMLRLPYSVAPDDEEEVQESSVLVEDVSDDKPIAPTSIPIPQQGADSPQIVELPDEEAELPSSARILPLRSRTYVWRSGVYCASTLQYSTEEQTETEDLCDSRPSAPTKTHRSSLGQRP